jgi:hypothetical protein
VLVATEFGRTAALNGTGGTDHGTASVAWLAGGAVRGGRVLADWPGLAENQLYENRDLAPTMDLRALAKGLLAAHLGLPAAALARVFPDSAQFTRNVIAEGVEPASSFPAGPYPHDRLTYRSRSVVEFETPAKTEGLGTASRLRASSDPIEGVAILISEGETSLVQLSARLPEADRDLMLPILRQLEREAAPTGHP